MEEHEHMEDGKNFRDSFSLVRQMDITVNGLICQCQDKYWIISWIHKEGEVIALGFFRKQDAILM